MIKIISKSNKRKSAETLIEVIMAIFIVATGSAVATNLIVTALQSNAFSRDSLVALNLAVEGLEAVRNVRDSNWLRFGFDKEGCWNMQPGFDFCDGTTNLILGGNYTVDLNPTTMQWFLSDPIISTLDLSDGAQPVTDAPYLLKYLDINGSSNHDLYASTGLLSIQDAEDAWALNDETPFYRMVTIDYGSTDPDAADEMTVTSMVQWRAMGGARQIILNTKLTNYQKVKK